MVKKLISVGTFTGIIAFIASCGILKQSAELKTFSQCTFSVKSINVQSIAGVNVSKINKVSDLPLTDYLTLAKQAFSKNIPSKIVITINAYNPSSKTGLVNGLDWELYLKEDLYSKGIINKPIQVLPHQETLFAVVADINLKEILNSKSLPQILALIIKKNESLNLSDLDAVVRIKPWYISKNNTKKYPGFIKIKL